MPSKTCTGQLTFLLLLGFTLAWIAAREGRWTRAAWLLGLLASIKPLFGVFWLYLLWRRQLRAAAIMAGTTVLAGVVGLAVFGWENHRAWLEALGSIDWTWATMNGSLLGWIYYLWLIAGPAMALWLSLAARPSTGRNLVILAAVPGLVWPFPLAGWYRLEPWMGVTGGSVYSWTTIALWTALVLDWRVRRSASAVCG